jgi:hypothetical protein
MYTGVLFMYNGVLFMYNSEHCRPSKKNTDIQQSKQSEIYSNDFTQLIIC